jgi:hypothetical protein
MPSIKDFNHNFYRTVCDINLKDRSLYLQLTFFYTLIGIVLPLAIVIVFNSFLIVRLYRSHDKYFQIDTTDDRLSYKELRDKKIQIENLKTTWTLILISFAFTFLTLPYIINYFITNYTYIRRESYSRRVLIRRMSILKLVQKITELLYVFNHSINFFLYMFTRNSFRRVLIGKLKCNYFKIPKTNLRSKPDQIRMKFSKKSSETPVSNTLPSSSTIYMNSKSLNNSKLNDKDNLYDSNDFLSNPQGSNLNEIKTVDVKKMLT